MAESSHGENQYSRQIHDRYQVKSRHSETRILGKEEASGGHGSARKKPQPCDPPVIAQLFVREDY